MIKTEMSRGSSQVDHLISGCWTVCPEGTRVPGRLASKLSTLSCARSLERAGRRRFLGLWRVYIVNSCEGNEGLTGLILWRYPVSGTNLSTLPLNICRPPASGWSEHSLPVDDLCTENAVILSRLIVIR